MPALSCSHLISCMVPSGSVTLNTMFQSAPLLQATDSKHMREKLIRRFAHDCKLQLVTAVRTPSSQNKWQKRKGARAVRKIEHEADQDNRLTPEAATTYRALSARCNYLAQDRPDIA